MEIPAIWIGTFVYANIITILCIGFTLTYMSAKIPNFAHGTYAGIGIYVCYTITRIMNWPPYISLPIAFIFGGLISLLIYNTIIVMIKRIGGKEVTLTIATIAIDLIITSSLYMYAYYLRNLYKTYTTQFLLKDLDFKFAGIPGVLFVSFFLNISIIILLHHFLTNTKTGIAMRATAEDSNLAGIIGINTERMQSLSWFMTGGLASVAGAIIPLWFQGSPITGAVMMPTIMAGSILGGFTSIYGTIIGGFSIGFLEIILVRGLQGILGSWFGEWRPIIPLIFLNLVLIIEPTGLYGFYKKYKEKTK